MCARHVLLTGLLVVAACRGRAEPRDHHQRDGASQRPTTLAIRVDGQPAVQVAAAELTTRRPLAELVAGRTHGPWALLDARTLDGRRLTIADVAARYPEHDVVVYLDAGRPTLGIFRRSRPDQPAHVRRALEDPDVALVGVAEIELRTEVPPVDADVDAGAPAPGLLVVVDGREVALSAAQLDALPAIPDDAGRKNGGWPLAAVLAAADVTTWTHLRARGREGALTVDRSGVSAPDVTAFVRRNRRGQLRISVGKRRGSELGELHDLVRLDVDVMR